MTKTPFAKVYPATERNLTFLAGRLCAGEVVALPTETVYGLAADAFNARACRRIYTAKGRPPTDPLIVHIRSLSELKSVAESNPAARRLAAAFWPGPLTMILPKKPAVPAIVTAHRRAVAVRMPAHRLFRRVLALVKRPLAAPSANPFGYISPTSAQHVLDGLGAKIQYILDGGPSAIGLESTIVDLRDPAHPRLLRPGQITRVELERALGIRVLVGPTSSPVQAAVPSARNVGEIAPGQMLRHYSPRTPLFLHTRLSLKQISADNSRAAWVFLRRPKGVVGVSPSIFWLDDDGRLPGAARRLFSLLRLLDGGGWTAIHIELARGGGLADAINDRLRRASAR